MGGRRTSCVGAGSALAPERDKVFETLTVAENLRGLVPGRRDGAAGPQVTLEQVFHYFPVLGGSAADSSPDTSPAVSDRCSRSRRRSCAGLSVLLVDELSLGLASLVVENLMQLVRRLRDELGLAVLLVEQNAGAALGIADHGYVMEHGRIVYDAHLVAHADVRGSTWAWVSGPSASATPRSSRSKPPPMALARSPEASAPLEVRGVSLEFDGLRWRTPASPATSALAITGKFPVDENQPVQLNRRSELSAPARNQ